MADTVTLRPVEPADLPILFEHQRDPAGIAMAGVGGRDREWFDEHWAKILADEDSLIRTVLADSRAGVKAFSVHEITRTDHRAVFAELVLPRG